MDTKLSTEINNLSLDEKVYLLEELWKSIYSSMSNSDLTPEQLLVLEQRLASYENGEAELLKWEDIRKNSKLS